MAAYCGDEAHPRPRPGRGDSHLALPRVAASLDELSASDFVTFRSLDQCPIAMTAHVFMSRLIHSVLHHQPQSHRDVISR